MKNSILLINKLAKENGFDVVGITNATTTNAVCLVTRQSKNSSKIALHCVRATQ